MGFPRTYKEVVITRGNQLHLCSRRNQEACPGGGVTPTTGGSPSTQALEA